MDEVNRLWDAYSRYKETAEQHEFVRLLILDLQLIPRYNDLKEHYTEEHAGVFGRIMRNVLASLGVRMDKTCDTCRHHLGGGYNNCRINLEAECAAGGFEAWEPKDKEDEHEQGDPDRQPGE